MFSPSEAVSSSKTSLRADWGAARVIESRRVRIGIAFDGLALWSLWASLSSRSVVVLDRLVLAGVMGSGESIKLAGAGALDPLWGVYE